MLALVVEVGRHVVVAVRGQGMIIGEQSAENLKFLLVQRLGRSILPFGLEGLRSLIDGNGKSENDSILALHRDHPAQCLEAPVGIDRLEVFRPLGTHPQGDQFLRPSYRLVPAIGVQGLVDLLTQLLGSFLVLAGQLA